MLNIFCFATDTFMESINSSDSGQGVPRGQINWNSILNADDAKRIALSEVRGFSKVKLCFYALLF